MRKTEDGYLVAVDDFVYEIMYRYYNEEVSIPEPECNRVRNIPEEVKIWKEEIECKHICDYKAKQERDYRNKLHILG